MASPLVIQIGLHYHTCAGDFDPARISAPAVQLALAAFVQHGLLEKLKSPDEHGANYVATEGLTVWCNALRAVNWPTREWIMPRPAESPANE